MEIQRHRRATAPAPTPQNYVTEERLKVFSAAVNRAMLASRMGVMTYDGNRDMYQALGYPARLTFIEHYLPKYIRHDIAKAIIDRPVRAAWRGGLSIVEKGSKGQENALEKAWQQLEKEHKLHSKFMRVDKLTGIGKYGTFLLGLNDISTVEQLQIPVSSKSNKLVYLKPLSEGSAKIHSFIQDPSDPRYGKPEFYTIDTSVEEGVSNSIKVHHSRVIHITEDLLEDEVYGTPRLEAVFNRLLDLDKIVGGDAETYWRNARPGFQGIVDKDFTLTTESEKTLQDQFDEYENKLRRFLLLEGVKVEELKQAIADPSKHVDIQIQMISAVTGIPKRILLGSERGELSSSQDKEEWNLWVQSRREEFMEPQLVRPVVDRFMELGILPTTDYTIHWDELFAMSPKEKAEIAQLYANALRYYTATPTAEYIVPKEVFLKKFLSMSKEEMEEIERLVDDLPDIESIINPQEQQVVGGPINSKNPMNGTGNDTVAKKQTV